jgi:hypothetical protein
VGRPVLHLYATNRDLTQWVATCDACRGSAAFALPFLTYCGDEAALRAELSKRLVPALSPRCRHVASDEDSVDVRIHVPTPVGRARFGLEPGETIEAPAKGGGRG